MSTVFKRILVLGILGSLMASAHASITWHFITLASGDPPEGSDWATLTISNLGLDEVELTLTHNNTSVDPQFISHLWLNLTGVPGNLSAEFGDPISSISWGADAFNNTGNQWDVDVDLFTSQGNRLDVGESVTWTMSGAGLDEQDFNTLSTPSGGNEAALGMIHLQGFGNGGSAKLTVDENFGQVPEPTSIAMLAIGGLALLARRKKQHG